MGTSGSIRTGYGGPSIATHSVSAAAASTRPTTRWPSTVDVPVVVSVPLGVSTESKTRPTSVNVSSPYVSVPAVSPATTHLPARTSPLPAPDALSQKALSPFRYVVPSTASSSAVRPSWVTVPVAVSRPMVRSRLVPDCVPRMCTHDADFAAAWDAARIWSGGSFSTPFGPVP